jgi:hypothetical protein
MNQKNARLGTGAFPLSLSKIDRRATAPAGSVDGLGLPLFSQQRQPDSPLRIEPYKLSKGPWYCCIDTFTGKSFGGRYTAAEVDIICKAFRSYQGQISPQHFGAVAEMAVNSVRAKGGAANA